MIANLSKSKQNLLDVVKVLINDPDFLEVLKLKNIESRVVTNCLFWNLGHDQGFAVIDLQYKQVFRVFDINEPLSADSSCGPDTAQLVLEDILLVIEYVDKVTLSLKFEKLLASLHARYGASTLMS